MTCTDTHNQNNKSTAGVESYFGNFLGSSTKIYPSGLEFGLTKPFSSAKVKLAKTKFALVFNTWPAITAHSNVADIWAGASNPHATSPTPFTGQSQLQYHKCAFFVFKWSVMDQQWDGRTNSFSVACPQVTIETRCYFKVISNVSLTLWTT